MKHISSKIRVIVITLTCFSAIALNYTFAARALPPNSNQQARNQHLLRKILQKLDKLEAQSRNKGDDAQLNQIFERLDKIEKRRKEIEEIDQKLAEKDVRTIRQENEQQGASISMGNNIVPHPLQSCQSFQSNSISAKNLVIVSAKDIQKATASLLSVKFNSAQDVKFENLNIIKKVNLVYAACQREDINRYSTNGQKEVLVSKPLTDPIQHLQSAPLGTVAKDKSRSKNFVQDITGIPMLASVEVTETMALLGCATKKQAKEENDQSTGKSGLLTYVQKRIASCKSPSTSTIKYAFVGVALASSCWCGGVVSYSFIKGAFTGFRADLEFFNNSPEVYSCVFGQSTKLGPLTPFGGY